MKKLSETLSELNINFSFPIEIKDANGNMTYFEDSYGKWSKREREHDVDGNVTVSVAMVIKALKLKGGKDADALINKMRDLGLESKVSKAHAEAATKILKGQIAKFVKNESTGLETQSTMKTLCDTFKEINFSFPIKIKDANGNTTYYEHSDGYWFKREYDANGNMTYFENSNGKWSKYEHDAEGKMTYYEKSNGTWSKYDYDVDGNETYYEDSDGTKRGTPRSVKTCEGKIVEIDGVKYELKAL